MNQSNISTTICAIPEDLPWYILFLTGSCSLLSVIGCLLTIISYVIVPTSRNFTRQLLLNLTTADLMTAVGFFVGAIRFAAVRSTTDDWLCVTQSFLTTFSNMASYFWTAFLAVHLWFSLAKGSNISKWMFTHVIFYCTAWGVPCLISFVAIATDALGEDSKSKGSGPWCFIRSKPKHGTSTIWVVMAQVLWEMLCYFISCIICVLLLWKMYRFKKRRVTVKDIAPHLRNEDRNFLFAGLILYVLKSWGNIRFLWLELKPDAYCFPVEKVILDILLGLQSACSAFQGGANCICFCLCDATIRRVTWSKLCETGNRNTRTGSGNKKTPVISVSFHSGMDMESET